MVTATGKRRRSKVPTSGSPSRTHGAESIKKTKLENGASIAPVDIARISSEHPEWPVSPSKLASAASFLRRAASASQNNKERILLVPDKDADGLSAGVIVERTLVHLGAQRENICIHHIPGGKSPTAREDLQSYDAQWIIVLDQGSGKGPPIVPGAEDGWIDSETPKERTGERVMSMVIDHHHVSDIDNDAPQGALLVNACQHPPVATSALLTWCICRPLWPNGAGDARLIDYLALIGTCGDLSVNVSWAPPWPDFEPELKRWGKSKIAQVVAMINAPRRTPQHDASASWTALSHSKSPLDILSAETNPSFDRLQEARRLVTVETERCTHTPPKFSKDGRVALLTIHSPYQVHPSVATRWSGTLKGAKQLLVVMCANTGFGAEIKNESDDKSLSNGENVDGKDGTEMVTRYVHFSCRIANAAKARGENPNIIEILRDYASRDPEFLLDLDRRQCHFARGHREASGGILPPDLWKWFVDLMQVGVRPSPPPGGTKSPKKQQSSPAQGNKLTNYFRKS